MKGIKQAWYAVASVVSVAVLVAGTAQAHDALCNDYVCAGLTIDGVMVDYFLKPLVDGKIEEVSPKGELFDGLSVRDVVKVFGRAGVEYIWQRCIHKRDDASSLAKLSVFGEAGHWLFSYVMRKLHLHEFAREQDRANYHRYGAPYVKRVLAVLIHQLMCAHKDKQPVVA